LRGRGWDFRRTINKGRCEFESEAGNSELLAAIGESAKAVERALREAGSLVLVASPTERQSGEFLRKAAEFVRRLGMRPKGDGDNAISLLLPNGSRIVGLPGTEEPCGVSPRGVRGRYIFAVLQL
jgi:hypothetical protein